MNEIDRISTHLRGRPIAQIYEQCNEKDDIKALKLLCILDFKLEQLGLYTKINATNPKLLKLLMGFHTFASFKYYDYAVKKEIGTRILRCKFCDLVGPYARILSHMAMNHNTHIGVKICDYCKRVDLEKHFEDNTLEQCYQNYIQRYKWEDHEWNENVCEIVTKFFWMLKKLADKFNASSVRQKSFTGRGYSSVERLSQNYGDDFPNECLVFKQPAKKNLKNFTTSIAFDIEFKQIMSHFCSETDNVHPIQRVQTSEAMAIDEQQQNIPLDQILNRENQIHVSFSMIVSFTLHYADFISNVIALFVFFPFSVCCFAEK